MYRITKQLSFDAAHFLRGLAPGHKCMNLHGHTYHVEVVLESATLDERGFVRDYNELRELRDHVDAFLDHQCLNEVGERFDINALKQPTAENIARYIFTWCASRWPETAAARVSETGSTWAEYRP